jgi:hypothetical protein
MVVDETGRAERGENTIRADESAIRRAHRLFAHRRGAGGTSSIR